MAKETPFSAELAFVDHEGRDEDEAMEFYRRVHGAASFEVGRTRPEGFAYRYRAVGDRDVTSATSSVAAQRRGTLAPKNHYVLAWTAQPGFTIANGTSTTSLAPNTPVLIPPGEGLRFEATSATHHVVRLRAEFLEAVAAARHDGTPALTRRPRDAALHGLRAAIRRTASPLHDRDGDRAQRTRADVYLAEAIAAAFDDAPDPESRLASGPRSVMLARAHVLAHPTDPLTVSQIAATAGVSVRALQLGFQQHVGVSPLQFLRQARLNEARRRLLDAHRDETNVADIARACGFAHLGRFASTYATAFGELPSATLRRHPRTT